MLAALAGMALVSGIGSGGGAGDLGGILSGLGAAVCYAALTMTNKFLKRISAMEATIVQLGVSSAALLPYALATGSLNLSGAGPWTRAGGRAGVSTQAGLFWFFSSVRNLARRPGPCSATSPRPRRCSCRGDPRELRGIPPILGACLILYAALRGSWRGPSTP